MRAGFIGLGAMGRHMARNLGAAGLLGGGVWNRSADKAQAFATETGTAARADVAELAQHSEVIVLCVSGDADVLGLTDALTAARGACTLVVDCSTIAPDSAREAARRLAAHEIEFVDAPVSGGTEGARDARLAIMAGGTDAAVERARPLFEAIGRFVAHMGPAGAGQATKAVNQVAVAGINQAVCEALAFADVEGLPLEKVIDVLSRGAAGNWFLEHRGRNMIDDVFPLGFRVSLHRKDLEICRRMAQRADIQLPLVEMTLLHYRRVIEAGDADCDISALYRLRRRLLDEQARRERRGR